MGTLYLVATPIGNLEDITLRALRTLNQVGLIAAEDTRHTAKLLSHYKILTPVTSYFEHNKFTKLDLVMRALENGDVALVSDAGTPGLNDPGYELVKAAITHGFPVSSIPGPSAPIAALVISGLPSDAFLYLGYLPRKKNDRRRLLSRVASQPYTLIFLETPHRMLSSLGDMLDLLGAREMCIARELTKLYEEVFRGTVPEALSHFEIQTVRGELTLVLEGAKNISDRWTVDQLREEILTRHLSGMPASRIAALVATESGWPRREIFTLIHQLQSTGNTGS